MAAIVYDGITVEFALAILKEAQSGGFLDGDIPDGGQDAIDLANYYIEEANKAYDAGMREDTVVAIKNMAEGIKTQSESDSAKVEIIVGAHPATSAPHPPKAHFDDVEIMSPEVMEEARKMAESYPRRSSGGLSESDEREADADVFTPKEVSPIELMVRQENLPVPKDWEADPREMPRDLTPLSDVEIRSLHGEYNAYAARARYLLTLEKADLRNVSHLRDEALRQAMLDTDKIDAETKKSKTNALIEAEAMGDKNYKLFADQVRELQTRVEAFQTLVDIYAGNVSALSREWTMRQDEWNKAR